MKSSIVIAKITFKEIIRQPLFPIIIAGGIALILLASCFTMFTFGEDSRLITDMGITTITLAGLIIAIFYNANSFSAETKKVTVATVLCKAVNKGAFITGKFFGVSFALLLVNLILFTVLLFILPFYTNLDDLESGKATYLSNLALSFDAYMIYGVYFSFLQVVILCAVSLLLSMWLTTVANIGICFAVYIFGNLSGMFHSFFEQSKHALIWVPKILYVFVPNLQNFSINSIRIVSAPPIDQLYYLITVSIYAVCFCAIMLTLTILSFEKKDML